MQTKLSSSVEKVTLTNKANMRVVIASYGARILSIVYKNIAGEWLETTLNYSQDRDILNDKYYMGATCGRVSNRISGARYVDESETVELIANDGKNTLHGGPNGFSHCLWSLSPVIKTSDNSQSVTLTYTSPNGDQGFVGELKAQVIYTLTAHNHLLIEYKASCDKNSPINMCNHTYFTLAEPSIHSLGLCVYADKYLPVNEKSIPTGEILFTQPENSFITCVNLGERISNKDVDDCYILNKNPPAQSMHLACVLTSKKNKLALSISTNQVAMQVYTGNYLPQKHSAIALEAQGLVDALNQTGFATDWVGPGKDYQKFVDYHFQSLVLND